MRKTFSKIDNYLIIKLHKLVIENTGGSFGIRDARLLDSSIQSPFATFEGEDLFPSLKEKAARLGYGIIKNHPFVDGNERVGLLAMLTFLEINGIVIECTDEELINLGLTLANGKTGGKDLLMWLIDK